MYNWHLQLTKRNGCWDSIIFSECLSMPTSLFNHIWATDFVPLCCPGNSSSLCRTQPSKASSWKCFMNPQTDVIPFPVLYCYLVYTSTEELTILSVTYSFTNFYFSLQCYEVHYPLSSFLKNLPSPSFSYFLLFFIIHCLSSYVAVRVRLYRGRRSRVLCITLVQVY